MSETPKKKPAKSAPAKKQVQKKATPKGTGKPGRPKKAVAPKPEVIAKEIEEFQDELQRIVEAKASTPENDVVIHASTVKKESLRKRMMKWFK